MSSPFPLEDRAELQGATWNPWEGQPQPRWYSGMGFDEDTAYLGPIYRALEAAGQGAAKGELMLSGAAHAFNSYVAPRVAGVPVLGTAMKYEEQQSEAAEQDAEQRVKSLTPDPATTGAATRILSSLVSGGYRVMTGSLLGGPLAGAALFGGSESASRYKELREKGVAPGTAAESAGVTGLTSAAGALIPGGFGASLFSKIATGAAANVALGIGNRYADHAILDGAGYKDMADQEKVWDGVGMFTDALLGGAFGGLAHLHAVAEAGKNGALDQPGARDAAMAANLAMRDRAASPGVPVDPAAAETHAEALQTAVSQLASDEPVNVADVPDREAAFVPRPEPDLTEARGLFVDALRDGGMLEEQQNLETMERALNARLSGKEVESPASEASGFDTARAAFEGGPKWIITQNMEPFTHPGERMPRRYDTEAQAQAEIGRLNSTVRQIPVPDRSAQIRADLERAAPEVHQQPKVAADLTVLASRAGEIDADGAGRVLDSWDDDDPQTIARVRGELESIIGRGKETIQAQAGGAGEPAPTAKASAYSDLFGENPRSATEGQVNPLAEPAAQAVQERPDLEIAGENGAPVKAADALNEAQQAVSDAERDSDKATTAAVNCFMRRGAA